MPSTAVGATAKPRPMVGRATFTMVVSVSLPSTDTLELKGTNKKEQVGDHDQRKQGA